MNNKALRFSLHICLMMLKKAALIFFVLVHVAASGSFAQIFSFSPGTDLPILVGNDTLSLGLAGGLNSTQFNKIDLNGDLVEDLVIFEKTNGRLLCFQSIPSPTGTKYRYQPSWEYFFPRLNNWVLFRDFDCDGYKDIFTNVPLGVQVYKQIPLPNGQPTFISVTNPLLSTTFAGSPVNLQIAATDIPIVEDLDGDGDLDIVCLQYGGTTLEYHKNQSVENNGTCGLVMNKTSGCWGGLATTNVCGDFVFGITCREGEASDSLQPERVQHFGASLLAIDMDGDGDKDLCLSDVGCEQLHIISNSGTPSVASFTNASFQFPAGNSPAWMRFFPTPFFEDVDGDNVKDLLVSPSSFGNDVDGNVINFKASAWLYKNTGTNNAPNFSFQANNFLQNQMIDVGEEAIPVLVDIDGDGRKDLLLGSRGNRFQSDEFYATIHHYRNIGSAQSPVFQFVTDDFRGFSSLGWSRLRPVAADLNGDNAIDILLLGTPSISQTPTQSRLFLNTSQAGQAVNWSGNGNPFSVPFTVYDCPLFTDVDGDGIQDMLLGKYAGRLQYFRNTGSNQSPTYSLSNNAALGLPRNNFARNINLAIADFDLNGETDLIISDSEGEMRIFKDFKSAIVAGTLAEFTDSLFIKLPFQANQTGTRYRVFTSPEVIDLDGNGTPDLLIGLTGGGIVALKNNVTPTQLNQKSKIENQISIKTQSQKIEVISPHPGQLKLLETTGKVTLKTSFPAGESSFEIGQNLKPGLYLIHVQTANETKIEKWLKTW